MIPRDAQQSSTLAAGDGASLVLLGVMLFFWGALLGAELHALRSYSATSAVQLSGDALDGAGRALRTFAWAHVAAGVGATAALVQVLARRNAWFPVIAALALGGIITSSHLFSVARASLPSSDSVELRSAL